MPSAPPRKPKNAQDSFSLSKGQKQCGIGVLVTAIIIGLSAVMSPTEEAVEVVAAKAGTAAAVTPLDDASFDKFVQSHPDGVLVDFYMPACKFCQKLAPEFEQAALKLREDKISLASVNQDTGAELMQRFGLERFPTVLWFWKGKNVLELPRSGEKKADEIIKWAQWAASPAVQELAYEEFKEGLETMRSSLHDSGRLMVAFSRAGSEAMRESFEEAAQKHRPRTIYLYVTGDTSEQSHILKAFAKDPAKDEGYDGAVNTDDVINFVKATLEKAAPPKKVEVKEGEAAGDAKEGEAEAKEAAGDAKE